MTPISWYAPGRARVQIPADRYAPIVHTCIVFLCIVSSHALAGSQGGFGDYKRPRPFGRGLFVWV